MLELATNFEHLLYLVQKGGKDARQFINESLSNLLPQYVVIGKDYTNDLTALTHLLDKVLPGWDWELDHSQKYGYLHRLILEKNNRILFHIETDKPIHVDDPIYDDPCQVILINLARALIVKDDD